MAWTDEMVADLKKMWDQGMTTGEIGKKLGVSKNSVVGKVHRLKLIGRPSPIKRKSDSLDKKPKETKPAEPKQSKPIEAKPQPKPAEQPKPAAPAIAQPQAKEIKKEEKPVFSKFSTKEESSFFIPCNSEKPKDGKMFVTDLDNHSCRWPLGDPKDENFHFCGKKVRLGQTYCDEHSAVAYVKTTKK